MSKRVVSKRRPLAHITLSDADRRTLAGVSYHRGGVWFWGCDRCGDTGESSGPSAAVAAVCDHIDRRHS